MKKIVFVLVMVVLSVVSITSADIIRGIDIDFVTIGNAGNVADTAVMGDGTTGYGTVAYEYQIGKYEITNTQWNAFVSGAGYPTGNPSNAYDEAATNTGIQQPTNGVSWYETLQFCNYLTSGDKSVGVYQFSGDNTNPGNFIGIDRVSAALTYDTFYVIPTEDEWYKAAYYTDSGYSLYANGTDVAPVVEIDSNYDGPGGAYSTLWNVGTGTEEQNGTFDMMGNAWEWNEALILDSDRGFRGGSAHSTNLRSTYRHHYDPISEDYHIGFRIASIPEPTTIALMSLGIFSLLRKRK